MCTYCGSTVKLGIHHVPFITCNTRHIINTFKIYFFQKNKKHIFEIKWKSSFSVLILFIYIFFKTTVMFHIISRKSNLKRKKTVPIWALYSKQCFIHSCFKLSNLFNLLWNKELISIPLSYTEIRHINGQWVPLKHIHFKRKNFKKIFLNFKKIRIFFSKNF